MIERHVKKIIEDVKKEGDAAISYYLKKYDKADIPPKDFIVSDSEIKNHIKLLPENIKNVISAAKRNVEKFHKSEFKGIKEWIYRGDGIKITQLIRPIEKVGIYIPGGGYSYFSTVIMSVIPARIAGVRDIYVSTPPNNISPALAYAFKMCGGKKLYRVGGVMAIVGFAFGTRMIPKVDLIVGPGNIYVTTAKKILYGEVGIDLLAGPTEIAIFADIKTDKNLLSLELMAQLEHGPSSKGYLITTSKKLASEVKKSLPPEYASQVEFHIAKSLTNAIELINKIGPEHLKIISKKPSEIIKGVKNAGTIFIGENSPTAVGDYWAGPSHILPTSSSSRFSSGLSVRTFIKQINVIHCKGKLLKDFEKIALLARLEGLKYHSESLLQRLKQ